MSGDGPTVTERLARILARPVDDATRRRAALHVLDWVGCAAIGLQSPVGERLMRFARTLGAGPCLGFGAGRLDPGAAILLNGGLGNVLEMDDTHRQSLLHPGPVVVPVALAVAEERGSAGPALLDAVVRGYEAMIRIGAQFGPAHARRFHTTATAAPFGAAAAAGSLLGLSPAAMVDALGNAGSQTGGVWQMRHSATMTKQLHTGRSAQTGWIAACLAVGGFPGPAAILEGPDGVFAALCPDGTPERVADDPDAPWRITETGFKPWPACRHAHAAIDAALLLRQCEPGAVAEADAIELVTTGPALAFCDNPDPATPHEARFSLQHATAVAMLDGPPGLAQFDPPALVRADVAALRHRVRPRADKSWGDAYPPRFRAALTLLRDGVVLARAEVVDAKGDPANPMTGDEIAAKATALMQAAGLSVAATARARAAIAALPDGGPVEAMTDALAGLVLRVRVG